MSERHDSGAPYEFRPASCFPASIVAGAIAGGLVPLVEAGRFPTAVVSGALLGGFVGAICGFTSKNMPRALVIGALGGALVSYVMCSLVSFDPKARWSEKMRLQNKEKKEDKKSEPEPEKPKLQPQEKSKLQPFERPKLPPPKSRGENGRNQGAKDLRAAGLIQAGTRPGQAWRPVHISTNPHVL